jgi:cobalamin synthase
MVGDRTGANGRARAQTHWFWQIMLVLGVVVAIASLVDLKFILIGMAAVWIAACGFSLHRIRRSAGR